MLAKQPPHHSACLRFMLTDRVNFNLDAQLLNEIQPTSSEPQMIQGKSKRQAAR